MHNLIIGTGMCSDAAGEESYYPQVGGVSSSSTFLDVYWRCVALFFASSVRHNPTAQHKLFVNRPGVPDIGTFNTQAFLDKLGVEVVTVPFTFAPPPNYYGAWRSTFYLLDIIKHLSTESRPDDCYIITDSDCLFIKSADALSKAVAEYGLLTYDTHFPPDEKANGLTRLDLQALYAEMSARPVPETPGYCGGDIFASNTEALQRLSSEIDPIWAASLERHRQGLTHFNTEEHFLSYLVYRLGYGVGTANPFISRIWTGRKYRTAAAGDFDLTLWHTPAEKKFGLRRLFHEMTRSNSLFWRVSPGDEFARYVSGFLGIPKSSRTKKVLDIAYSVLWKLQSSYANFRTQKLAARRKRTDSTFAEREDQISA